MGILDWALYGTDNWAIHDTIWTSWHCLHSVVCVVLLFGLWAQLLLMPHRPLLGGVIWTLFGGISDALCEVIQVFYRLPQWYCIEALFENTLACYINSIWSYYLYHLYDRILALYGVIIQPLYGGNINGQFWLVYCIGYYKDSIIKKVNGAMWILWS